MKIVDDSPPVLTALDRPNSYIGRSVPRPNLTRLTEGRGQYVSDVTLPRMAHVAYLRSPHAACANRVDRDGGGQEGARRDRGRDGRGAFQGRHALGCVLTHLKGIKSAPQHAIAVDRACWQGEAVCAVVAKTRALAEDACELVEVSYEELPPSTDAETALDGRHACDPSGTWRQSHLRAQPCCGRADKGFAEAGRGGRDHIPFWPSHRRVQRGARDRCRTGIRRAALDRVSRRRRRRT
jgi:carbon-monoxide dehydrogenase large subunit